MKLAIIGASGTIGTRITQEALSRGHDVTAIVRDPSKVQQTHDHLRVVTGDALQPDTLLTVAAGQEVLISAFGPDGDPADFSTVAHNLIRVVQELSLPRLIVVGGAGSLEVAPGVRLYDTPEFPDAWRAGARGHGAALAIYRDSDIPWTFFSPAEHITPGERTGHYRTGGDQLLRDAEGKSLISTEDYAVALLDEVEQPRFIRQRFTAAY